jgi:uncharacterized protein YjbI with pentapeptide repeats
VSRGESLERFDLRGLNLAGAALAHAKLTRAELDGTNFESADLRNADASKASLREAYLVSANLQNAIFTKADMDGANLSGANLSGADLSRADLEGANFEGANLSGAKLRYAQLDSANFAGADLSSALLTHADLSYASLIGVRGAAADFRRAQLRGAKLQDADFADALFDEADASELEATGVSFVRARLSDVDFGSANLMKVDFSDADLRRSLFRGTLLSQVCFTGARVYGLDSSRHRLDGVVADWVETAREDTTSHPQELWLWMESLLGEERVQGAESNQLVSVEVAPRTQTRMRYVGKGDVLKNAVLEFGAGADIAIDGHLEGCHIRLASDAHLRIGETGQLIGCQIVGGLIEIQGLFLERERCGLVFPKQLLVSQSGAVDTTIEQPMGHTRIGFERGCRLRLRIQNPDEDSATARRATRQMGGVQ